VSVVPSLFEPFGIVALEAMAAKSPVVASDTGGLSEIIEHDVTGVKVYPNNPDSLAWGITKVLLDDNYRKYLRENAYKRVLEKYDWEKIAQQTKLIYEGVLGEYSKSFWA
jgi:glycosyltransferase involved in cell wall biosynthesis